MKIKAYLGLDVHKNSIVVAIAKADGSEPFSYGKWGGSNLSAERGLVKLLKSLGLTKEEVSIVYEAGPSGFVLARRLLQLGYECIIVGPSEVPSKAGERVKTDKRDARKLARFHRAGELTAIHIPEARDEAVRDLCRARSDASQALARSKQQLVVEEYIMEVDAGVARVDRIEQHMKDLLPSWERQPYVRALMAFRGFQEVAAMTEISELGDLSRFSHPRQLMGYLGLVSNEHSSGEKRRQGGITKTGNGHARWMLIECASHYSHTPRVSPNLSARQAGQSQEVKAIAWRAQNRLNYRFKKLSARSLHRNKVVVAVARELCGFIWELHQQVTKEITAKVAA